jgi:recombination associated protein RdgC
MRRPAKVRGPRDRIWRPRAPPCYRRRVGLFSGSLSYTRHFIDGEIAADFPRNALKEIQKRALRPLVPEDEDLLRTGWCMAGDPSTLEFEHNDVFFNEFVNLGLRIDRWVVPGPLLRAKVKEAEVAFLAKKGRDRLTRIEKKELKELTAKRLRRQLTPASKATDLSWSLGEGCVRLFSHSPGVAAHLADLFYKTFNLKLVPEAPYTLAARLGLSKNEETAWTQFDTPVFVEFAAQVGHSVSQLAAK